MRADNKGEGGIYALFALLRKKPSWAAILTMVGASALLADGVITPAITVTSSIEGLKLFNPDIPVVAIVLLIFAVLFFVQQFGTNVVGASFSNVIRTLTGLFDTGSQPAISISKVEENSELPPDALAFRYA